MTDMERKTLLVELRFQEGPESASKFDMLDTLDDLNDIFVDLAIQLEMDILSVSHSHHYYSNGVQFSATGVFVYNEQDIDAIVKYINDSRGEHAHAFEDRGKVSVLLNRRPGGRI